MAWWLMPRTPDPEVGGSIPTRVKPCCVLEQGTFTPQEVLVIPRKRWLRPNMTEKLFTGTLRINQPTNLEDEETSPNKHHSIAEKSTLSSQTDDSMETHSKVARNNHMEGPRLCHNEITRPILLNT